MYGEVIGFSDHIRLPYGTGANAGGQIVRFALGKYPKVDEYLGIHKPKKMLLIIYIYILDFGRIVYRDAAATATMLDSTVSLGTTFASAYKRLSTREADVSSMASNSIFRIGHAMYIQVFSAVDGLNPKTDKVWAPPCTLRLPHHHAAASVRWHCPSSVLQVQALQLLHVDGWMWIFFPFFPS